MALILSGDTGVPASGMPTGSVIQTVQTITSVTDFSTSSTTNIAVTGSTATITPSSATSKILITLIAPRVNCYNATGLAITIYRTSPTTADIGTTAGYRFQPYGSSADQRSGTLSVTILDSPGTTSPVTYQMYGRTMNGGTTVFLADGSPQTFVLQEIHG